MEYLKIKGLEKKMSRMVYGCTTETMMKGEDVKTLLDEIYRLGINAFDTAENYGLSEVSLGRCKKVVCGKRCGCSCIFQFGKRSFFRKGKKRRDRKGLRMAENVKALQIELTQNELNWLNLE